MAKLIEYFCISKSKIMVRLSEIINFTDYFVIQRIVSLYSTLLNKFGELKLKFVCFEKKEGNINTIFLIYCF